LLPGYGLGSDGVLEPIAAEQHAVEVARDLRGRGMTFRAISTELATVGHRNRAGRPYHPQQIARMVEGASAH
jgi:hypothetical protein